jgi:FKBP-type peptidyl-prolyl cis-trans isomerase FkpA
MKWLGICCLIVSLTACMKDDKERKKIESYVKANNLQGQYTSSGLFYTIQTLGTGGHPISSSTVTVTYKGYLLDGSVFDSTERGKSVSFALRQVISGWQEGIPKFQKGGKGKLIIPSNMAYGRQSQPGIPKNSILVFDVALLDWE